MQASQQAAAFRAAPSLPVSKPSLILAWIGFVELATALGLGAAENLLLALTGGAMGLSLTMRPSLPARVAPVLCAFLALFLLYAGLTIRAPTFRGASNTINIAISAAFFLFFASNAPRFVRFSGAAWVCLLFAFAVALVGTAAGAVAKNTVSGLCVYLILTAGLIWTARGASPMRTGALIFALVALMGLLLGHRTMAGVGLIAIGAFLAIRLAPLNLTRNLILLILAAGVILLIGLYARIWGLDIRDLDALVKEASGRTASSGRQVIWPLIIEATSANVWFGLGSGMLFEQLYDSHWSAHSYFLQIYMQSGLVGLACLGAVLLTVWRAIGRPRRGGPVSAYLSACFLVVLVHSALEVFLMQANPAIGCSAWMMLGLGVGLVRSGDRGGGLAGISPGPPPRRAAAFSDPFPPARAE